MSSELRQHSPSSERNRAPILSVLKRFLPADGEGLVLEIASGTGQHTAWFSAAFPNLTWQPSDLDEHSHASISAWIAHAGVANAHAPLCLDATANWAALKFDIDVVAMLNINMIHISPWEACEGLMSKAGTLLAPGAHLYMYGPYARGGNHTAQSNAAFDQSLRARNSTWGIRNLEDVIDCAVVNGLDHIETIEMPANNLSVIYRRRRPK
jgi:hypothetical protein